MRFYDCKKVLLKSLDSKINLDDFDDEGLFYILPTEDSLIDKRVNYIHDKGFLKNIKFMTFDALFFKLLLQQILILYIVFMS